MLQKTHPKIIICKPNKKVKDVAEKFYTNERLNSIMLCIIHKEIMEELDDEIRNQFIWRSSWRKSTCMLIKNI